MGVPADFSQNKERFHKTVRFPHPVQYRSLPPTPGTNGPGTTINGYPVVYEAPTDTTLAKSFATIACTGISTIESDTLKAELWGILDAYNGALDPASEPAAFLNDNNLFNGSILTISGSTMELAG